MDDFRETLDPSDTSPETYPELSAFPTGALFQFVACERTPPAEPPEYVYVRLPDKEKHAALWFLAEWNLFWESGRWRPDSPSMPPNLAWLKRKESLNVRLVAWDGKTRGDAYLPLFHLLPLSTITHFGLPPRRRGVWPPISWWGPRSHDFEDRLAQAFSHHIWPFLCARGKRSDFSQDDPLRVLTHNLDFWLPYLDRVAQRRQLSLGRVPYETQVQRGLRRKNQRTMPRELRVARPLYGGSLWIGEAEAHEATSEIIEEADRSGRLRSIVDAVRSNRIEDDFSARWSFAREDFERRLYRKRSKLKVTFVELDETIPVHGPGSEIEEELVWEDFASLLDPKERRIVVLLRSGHTRLAVIANELGYANHSPVSKALAGIRRKAIRYLGN